MGHCRACYHTKLHPIHRIAELPIAHEFGKTKEEAMSRKTYDMLLEVCDSCGVAQFQNVIPPEVLYSDYNYCFSTWKTQPHIADEVAIINELMPSGTLFEVGCNDGLFLDSVQPSGDYKCIGIEPNSVSAEDAAQKGYQVYNSFFEQAIGNELENDSADILVVRQVLEHIVDVKAFFQSARQLLKEDGILCIEVPNTQIAIDVGDISCLWEEHISYFTPKSLQALFLQHDFEVLIERRYTFSGEALFVVGKKRPVGTFSEAHEHPAFSELRSVVDSYFLFKDRVNNYADNLKSVISHAKEKSLKTVIYGSGCRSSVLINAFDLQQDVDFIVDDQPEKRELYMAHVPVKISALDQLDESLNYLFLLSVNMENEDKVTTRIRNSDFKTAIVASLHSPNDIADELEKCREAMAQL